MKFLKKFSKKGQVLANLEGLMIGLAVIAVVAVVVFLIMGQLASNTTVAADANASAAVATTQAAADQVPDWLSIIVIVVIGGIIIGLVSFFRRGTA